MSIRLPYLLACLLPVAAGVAAARPLAFLDVTVLDPSTGAVQAGRDVVVEDGRVVRVEPHGTLAVPASADRVPGQGRLWLVPGLIDAHVHLEYFDDPALLRLFLAHGVTTVRQMDGRAAHLRWRDDIPRLAGPRLVVGSRILNGRFGADPEHRIVTTPAEARAAVAALADQGFDFIKTYHGLAPPVFEAVVEAARQRGLEVAGHVPLRMEVGEAVAAGLHAIEHITGIHALVAAFGWQGQWDWKELGFATPVDPARFTAAAQALAHGGAWLVPTLGAADLRYLDADWRRQLERQPAMRRLPAEVRAAWDPERWTDARAEWVRDLTAADLRQLADGVDSAGRLLAELHRQGVRLGIGTDTPQPYLVPGWSLLQAMQRYVAAGIPSADVLAIATAGNAALLQRPELGCIRPGCAADLVLLAADPRTDFGQFADPLGIMVAGRWHPRGGR